MLFFDFLVNGLGIASPTYFTNDFLKKLILMLYLLTGQIS